MTCSTIARPQMRCSGLGLAERIRVPSPAARTIALRRSCALPRPRGRSEPLARWRCARRMRGRGTNEGSVSIAPGGGLEPPYSEPKSDVLPLNDPGLVAAAHRIARVPRSAGSLRRSYGFSDQEAAQADAQEEAQEDASPHPPPAPQVVPFTSPAPSWRPPRQRPRSARMRGRRRVRRARTTSLRCRRAPARRPLAPRCGRASRRARVRRRVPPARGRWGRRAVGPPSSSHAR